MPTFRLSAKSLEDLKSIGRFTLKYWGREQHKIYLSKLDESFHILADQPQLNINA
jgi:toxin ParE1/3/4